LTSSVVVASASEKHNPGLDGVRGIAILLVFFSHYGGGHKSTNIVIHLWSMMCDFGWVGVDLFFVLSGFLITGILYDSINDNDRVKNFYARRALRIFPLFYGVLVAFLLLTPVLKLHWRAEHVLYFVYLTNLMPLLHPIPSPGACVSLGHFWSLAVEEQFYLVWPFIVWKMRDRNKLLSTCGVLIAVAFILRVILIASGVNYLIVYELLFTRMDSLLAGGALALIIRGPHRKIPYRAVIVFTGLAIVAMIFFNRGTDHENVIVSTIGYSIIALFCAGIVYAAWKGGGIIGSIAATSPLRFFGRYSYGMYIYHGLLMSVLFPLIYPIEQYCKSAVIGGFVYLIFSLVITLVVAMLSFHFFETPFLRLKKYFV